VYNVADVDQLAGGSPLVVIDRMVAGAVLMLRELDVAGDQLWAVICDPGPWSLPGLADGLRIGLNLAVPPTMVTALTAAYGGLRLNGRPSRGLRRR
jgi:hypothetical protein